MAVIYYYYAYMENGKCVDVERTRTRKSEEDMENYVEITVEEYTASYDEDTESEYYIIGKSWNGEEWYIDDMHYYAVIDENFICRNFVTSADEIIDAAYVTINKGDYDSQNYFHQKYDKDMGVFYEVPFTHYANADTTLISVNGTDVTLQQTIEALQLAIDNKDVDITANEVVSLLRGVDGEGSNLDADKLDGHDSSEFLTTAQYSVLSAEAETTASERYDNIISSLNDIANTVSAVPGIVTSLGTIDTKLNTLQSITESLSDISIDTDEIPNVVTLLNTIIGKVDAIPTNTESGPVDVIKSIQRGTVAVSSGTSLNIDVALATAVNPDKCIVIINGSRVHYDDLGAHSSDGYAVSLTSTTLTIGSSTLTNTQKGNYSWQVIEFN